MLLSLGRIDNRFADTMLSLSAGFALVRFGLSWKSGCEFFPFLDFFFPACVAAVAGGAAFSLFLGFIAATVFFASVTLMR